MLQRLTSYCHSADLLLVPPPHSFLCCHPQKQIISLFVLTVHLLLMEDWNGTEGKWSGRDHLLSFGFVILQAEFHSKICSHNLQFYTLSQKVAICLAERDLGSWPTPVSSGAFYNLYMQESWRQSPAKQLTQLVLLLIYTFYQEKVQL